MEQEWTWPLSWAELETRTIDDADRERPELGRLRGEERARAVVNAVRLGVHRLGDDLGAHRPAVLTRWESAVAEAIADPAELGGATSGDLLVAWAAMAAHGCASDDPPELDRLVASMTASRRRDLEWIDPEKRAERSVALSRAGRFEQAAEWSGAGKLVKRPTKRAAFPWSVPDSLRYLASAHAAGTPQADLRPAFLALVEAFPRKFLLEQISTTALVVAASDHQRRFCPTATVAEVLADAGVRCCSGLDRHPPGAKSPERYPRAIETPLPSWSAAAEAAESHVAAVACQRHTRMCPRGATTLDEQVARYLADVGLVGSLQGRLRRNLALVADVLQAPLAKWAEKEEFWRDTFRPAHLATLLEAFAIPRPPELAFPSAGWSSGSSCAAPALRPTRGATPTSPLPHTSGPIRGGARWSAPPTPGTSTPRTSTRSTRS
ncbi:MAG: hypothetical protein ABMA64_24665 [Myxococcota bacterium]